MRKAIIFYRQQAFYVSLRLGQLYREDNYTEIGAPHDYQKAHSTKAVPTKAVSKQANGIALTMLSIHMRSYIYF